MTSEARSYETALLLEHTSWVMLSASRSGDPMEWQGTEASAKSQHQLAMGAREPATLEMNPSLADVLTAPFWETLSQAHPAKLLLKITVWSESHS